MQSLLKFYFPMLELKVGEYYKTVSYGHKIKVCVCVCIHVCIHEHIYRSMCAHTYVYVRRYV